MSDPQPKRVRLYFVITKRLAMLLELAADNEISGEMWAGTRSYSHSEALYVLACTTSDFEYLKWFLDEAHSINLICSYETEDVREPLISNDHEALAALHQLEREVAAERQFLEAGMTERSEMLPWRQQKEA